MTPQKPKHLLHVFATFGAGGPQVQFCQIANHFGNRYKHSIISMDDNYDAKKRLRADLPVELIPLKYQKNQFFHNIKLFRKVLAHCNPDLLLTYNWGAIEWAISNFLFPVCPHIHCEHGFRPDEIDRQLQRRVLLRYIFLSRSFKVIMPSMTMKKIALTIWKLNQKNVLYIPNGIDVKRFQRPLPHQHIDPPKPLIIGTVAHLRKEKNIHRMIRIFNNVNQEIPSELHIAGDGDELESITQYIHTLGLTKRVRLLGSIDNPVPVLQNFDIFIISSDTEQMPYSVLEAMASSLPVVGTDVGDIKYMVSDSNKKFIINKDNEDTFSNILNFLIKNKSLRTDIGEKNRKHCMQKFSIEHMFKNFEVIFESAMIR